MQGSRYGKWLLEKATLPPLQNMYIHIDVCTYVCIKKRPSKTTLRGAIWGFVQICRGGTHLNLGYLTPALLSSQHHQPLSEKSGKHRAKNTTKTAARLMRNLKILISYSHKTLHPNPKLRQRTHANFCPELLTRCTRSRFRVEA